MTRNINERWRRLLALKDNFTIRLVLIAAIAIVSLVLRRPDQFRSPALFVEEGSQFLHQFLDKGWLYIFEPVNGYMIVPSKLVSLLALHTSFVHLPVATVVYTAMATGLLAVIIAVAPTTLRFRSVAALLPLLIPIEPEPIGVGGYIFWMAGLMSVLALLWRADRAPIARCVCAAMGALASPLAILITPLAIVRAIVTRNRVDIAAAVASLLPAVWQLALIRNYGGASAPQVEFTVDYLAEVIERFVGDFFWKGDGWISLTIGIIVSLVLGVMVFRAAWKADWTPLALAACLGAAIAASIARVPIESIDSVAQAPRYFFYPFTLIGWLLLYLAVGAQWRKAFFVVMLVPPLAFMLAPNFARRHDSIDWTSAAMACVSDAPPFEPRVVRQTDLGSELLFESETEGGFAPAGVHESVLDIGKPTFGSGRINDAEQGHVTYRFIEPVPEGWFAVRLITGPDASFQSLSVVGTDQVYELSNVVSELSSWGYVFLPSGGATGLVLEDRGSEWGQWSAIADVRWMSELDGPPIHSLPVHFDGSRTSRWKVELSAAQCEDLSSRAIFD